MAKLGVRVLFTYNVLSMNRKNSSVACVYVTAK